MHFLYSVIEIFFAIVLVFAFLAGGIYIIFTFGTSSFYTTSITNAGFTIFAGCASVCFSWARNLEDKVMKNKINIYGESLFYLHYVL